MPPRNWRMRIEDILQATDRIGRYTSGLSFEDYGPSGLGAAQPGQTQLPLTQTKLGAQDTQMVVPPLPQFSESLTWQVPRQQPLGQLWGVQTQAPFTQARLGAQ